LLVFRVLHGFSSIDPVPSPRQTMVFQEQPALAAGMLPGAGSGFRRGGGAIVMSLRIVAALFLFLGTTQLNGATFTASASGCSYRTNTGPATVEAIVTDKDCTGFSGDVDAAYARSGPLGLGASADHRHTCCDTATGAGGLAYADTNFMITGPAGNVTISLNLALTGTVGGGISEDTSVRSIRIDAVVFTQKSFGEFIEIAGPGGFQVLRSGDLVLPGDLCATVCVVPTIEVSVPTNVWVNMTLTLSASAGGGIGNHTGWADASHTLYFPKDGPVFNVPDDRYSAEIPDMNVAGNRVVREGEPGDAVPEPGTYVLVGGGLFATELLRRRAWLGGARGVSGVGRRRGR
jgi:hypothetical protein